MEPSRSRVVGLSAENELAEAHHGPGNDDRRFDPVRVRGVVSTFRPYQATCPACRHEWQVELARGLHITCRIFASGCCEGRFRYSPVPRATRRRRSKRRSSTHGVLAPNAKLRSEIIPSPVEQSNRARMRSRAGRRTLNLEPEVTRHSGREYYREVRFGFSGRASVIESPGPPCTQAILMACFLLACHHDQL